MLRCRLPKAPELAARLGGGGRRDEPVRHVADPARNCGAQRESPGLGVRRPHCRGERRWRLLDVLREFGEVGGEVVQIPAGRRYIDQPEERGPKLRVLGREPHRALVERRDRPAGGGGKLSDDRGSDLMDLSLQVAIARSLVAHTSNLPA